LRLLSLAASVGAVPFTFAGVRASVVAVSAVLLTGVKGIIPFLKAELANLSNSAAPAKSA